MIVETVTFRIKPGMTREDVLEDGRGTLERWTGFKGLVRKFYVMVDADTAMGVYQWESEADADRSHDEAWLDRAEAHRGNRPVIKRFDALMLLDNRAGEVLEFPPE